MKIQVIYKIEVIRKIYRQTWLRNIMLGEMGIQWSLWW